jgi:hypothetical protein
MNQPASLPSDRVAGIPWNGWPTCSGLGGRNRLDYVADFTGMRTSLAFWSSLREKSHFKG